MKTLVILGHPNKESFCAAIADTYYKSAKRKNQVKYLSLPKIKFDPILHHGYHKRQKFEPSLVKAQRDIRWADHLVFVFPVWWGSAPALLTGFIDRTFLPGFAFKFHQGKFFPDRLLKGKTAELIITSGGSKLEYFIVERPLIKIFKDDILEFCGIKLKRKTIFYSMDCLSKERAKKVLRKIERLCN